MLVLYWEEVSSFQVSTNVLWGRVSTDVRVYSDSDKRGQGDAPPSLSRVQGAGCIWCRAQSVAGRRVQGVVWGRVQGVDGIGGRAQVRARRGDLVGDADGSGVEHAAFVLPRNPSLHSQMYLLISF